VYDGTGARYVATVSHDINANSITRHGARAERLRRQELRDLLAEIRQKIKDYSITPEQLFGPDLSDLVRYCNPETGQTWSGFSRPLNWIEGKDRNLYRVD
jgi:DNA-binding protein H-NS